MDVGICPVSGELRTRTVLEHRAASRCNVSAPGLPFGKRWELRAPRLRVGHERTHAALVERDGEAASVVGHPSRWGSILEAAGEALDSPSGLGDAPRLANRLQSGIRATFGVRAL
jgi:hypothetical protein